MQRDIGKYVKRASSFQSGIETERADCLADDTPQPVPVWKCRPQTGILGMLGIRKNENNPLPDPQPNNRSMGGNLFVKRTRNSSVSAQGPLFHSGLASTLHNFEEKRQRKDQHHLASSTAQPLSTSCSRSTPTQTPSPSNQPLVPVIAAKNLHTNIHVHPDNWQEQPQQYHQRCGQAESEHSHQPQQQPQQQKQLHGQAQQQQQQHHQGSHQLATLHLQPGSGNDSIPNLLRTTTEGQQSRPPKQPSQTMPTRLHSSTTTPSTAGFIHPNPTSATISYPSACSSLPSFTSRPKNQLTDIKPSSINDLNKNGTFLIESATTCGQNSWLSGNPSKPVISNRSSSKGVIVGSKKSAAGKTPAARPAVVVFGASRRAVSKDSGLLRGRHVTLYGSSDFNHFDDGGGSWDGSSLGMEDVDGADIGSMGWEGVGTRDN